MNGQHTFETTKRWSDLEWKEKMNYAKAVDTISNFLEIQDEADITWNSINNLLGVSHLYRFSFDDLSKKAKARNKTLTFDELGLHLRNE